MGSKWFAESVNALPEAAFMFEFEHCLRSLGRGTADGIAAPGATLHYLRHACDCPESCDASCNSSSGDEGARDHHRIRAGLSTRSPSLYTINGSRHLAKRRCQSVGISLGALGPAYISHIEALLRLEPQVSIVVHVRSNHVKHALSFIRTSCDGEMNHVTSQDLAKHASIRATSKLYVPPPLLLLHVLRVAEAQSRVLKDADHVRRGKMLHIIRYEAMQLDMHSELSGLMLAIAGDTGELHRTAGIARADAPGIGRAEEFNASTGRVDTLVKAGAEDVADMLSNAKEIEEYFRPLPCLHSMLTTRTPLIFSLDACDAEVKALEMGQPVSEALNAGGKGVPAEATGRSTWKAFATDMAATRVARSHRPHLGLTTSECQAYSANQTSWRQHAT